MRKPWQTKGQQSRAEAFAAPLPVRDITPAEVQRRLSFRLKQIIGPAGRYGLADAARIADIHPRTLKAYVDGTACPNLARYGRLLRAFGPEAGIELAMMLGWEPRATDRRLPLTDDVRELRESVAQAIRAIDLVVARGDRDTHTPARPSGHSIG